MRCFHWPRNSRRGPVRMLCTAGWSKRPSGVWTGSTRPASATAIGQHGSPWVKARTGEDALYRRLVEEAKWGLDWIDKTSLGDGYRTTWVTMGLWTNGILGDYDDVTARAQNSPSENFQAAAAEALGARVLRQ